MAQAISVRRSEPRPGGSGHSVEKKPSRWRWNVFALIVGLLFLAPFFWLVLTAFERYGGLNLTGGGGYTFSNFTGLFGKTAAARAIGEGVGGSLLNSIWPGACANNFPGASLCLIHSWARAPSSWQTRSIVSSETLR